MLSIEKISMDSGVTRFIIKGRMHLGNALSDAEYEAKGLLDAGVRKLLIDLTETETIDSAALGMLIVTCSRMSAVGGKSALFGVNPRVQNVFNITHANKMLSIHETMDAALLALE
ncbi:MAG TPA: STAS domain-containing protein [Paludibaculum sp.]|jgi:anti-anti-sigma factor